jgi:hypothetical protein
MTSGKVCSKIVGFGCFGMYRRKVKRFDSGKFKTVPLPMAGTARNYLSHSLKEQFGIMRKKRKSTES